MAKEAIACKLKYISTVTNIRRKFHGVAMQLDDSLAYSLHGRNSKMTIGVEQMEK